MNIKTEEDNGSNKESAIGSISEYSMPDPPKDYEKMVQKLEEEVRNHIRVEQQLKLHIESLQFKMEEIENVKLQMARQLKTSNEVIDYFFYISV